MRKKILTCLSAIAFVSCLFPSQALAADTPLQPMTASYANTNDASTKMPDTIEYHYRTASDGRLQYRRWNVTKNCWVDPRWIDV